MAQAAAAQRDAAYRRGTVLGLTVAEVFILLLFLLLLALLVMVRDWETERERETKERQRLNDHLVILQEQQEKWQEVVSEFETPEKVFTLRQQKEEAERSAAEHRERADALQEVVSEGGDAAKEAAAQAEKRLQAERELQAAQRDLQETQRQLDLLRVKGENPPCWYEIVSDAKRGTREKPLYALNVAVFDEHMVLHRPEPPAGGATDDGGATYASEAARLPFGAIPYGKPLSDAQLVRHLQPISAAGKEEQVRSYACIFWLRVWDKTSADAKERWKQAHDGILEGMFGAYTVRDDPWPGG